MTWENSICMIYEIVLNKNLLQHNVEHDSIFKFKYICSLLITCTQQIERKVKALAVVFKGWYYKGFSLFSISLYLIFLVISMLDLQLEKNKYAFMASTTYAFIALKKLFKDLIYMEMIAVRVFFCLNGQSIFFLNITMEQIYHDSVLVSVANFTCF